MFPALELTAIDISDEKEVVERSVEEVEEAVSTTGGSGDSGFRVILYNDDHHGQDEVTAQIHKATGYTWEKCYAIMVEAHSRGRAICYRGDRPKCQQVTRVLREIHLQCEVDCD